MDIFSELRPKNLNEFIGTESNKNKLNKILSNPDNFHVYLVHGSSGMGKTTFARIFANHFEVESPDLFEINCGDARGIDNAREFLEIVKTKPLICDKKVVILDEAHMLTELAQNTLLKGLEDLPQTNYVFICSTNPEKLIKTIKTRCYEIDLNIKPENISINSNIFNGLMELTTKLYSYTTGNQPKPQEIKEYVNNYLENYRDNPSNFSIRTFMSFSIDFFNGNSDFNEALKVYNRNNSDATILLCRYLAKWGFNKRDWGQLVEQIDNISNYESARITVINYFTAILRNKLDWYPKYIIDTFMKMDCSPPFGKTAFLVTIANLMGINEDYNTREN